MQAHLIDLNARLYDPLLGKFLSPDPLIGNPDNSQAWNAYSYSQNNPMSGEDPTGRETDWAWGHRPRPNAATMGAGVQLKPPAPAGHGKTIPSGVARLGARAAQGSSAAKNSFLENFGASVSAAAANNYGGVAQDIQDAVNDPLGALDEASTGLIAGSAGPEGEIPGEVGKGLVNAVIAGGALEAKAAEILTTAEKLIAETLAGKGNFTSGVKTTADDLLEAGEKFVGNGYKEIGNPGSGVFRSADGAKQFRIDNNSLLGNHEPGVPHGHLEIYEPGAATPSVNNHIQFGE